METAAIAGMTGGAMLNNLKKYRIAITIKRNTLHFLRMTRRLSLDPQGIPTATPIRATHVRNSRSKRFLVHPRQHENFVRHRILGYRGHKLASIKTLTNLGWDILVSILSFLGGAAHRKPGAS